MLLASRKPATRPAWRRRRAPGRDAAWPSASSPTPTLLSRLVEDLEPSRVRDASPQPRPCKPAPLTRGSVVRDVEKRRHQLHVHARPSRDDVTGEVTDHQLVVVAGGVAHLREVPRLVHLPLPPPAPPAPPAP